MIRTTRQRKAILAVLKEEQRPLTVNEIFDLSLRDAPGLGLRTVYRNIRELVEEGRMVCVEFPGQPPRYELVQDRRARPHFICGVCNKVFELDPSLEPPLPDVQVPGFIIQGSETIFYGRCANPEQCQHNVTSPDKGR